MPYSELPHVVGDEEGTLRFNGFTAEERLAALDGPADATIGSCDRMATGRHFGARREGVWRYSVAGDERFAVAFAGDQPVSPPAGWHDDEWPRPSIESYRAQREVLEIVLREYRRPDDIERIYHLLVPRFGNSVPVVRGLMDALGVPLTDAKMALDAACERAKRSHF